MRRIIYDVAVSLDGFIAAPGNDISAFPMEGPHVAAYQARLATYSTVIMGRKTYEIGYRFGLQPGARAYPHMDHHIFSSSISLPDGAEVSVHREDWLHAIDRLRAASGGDIYLCGGGKLAGWFANHGRIDILRLKRAPVALGLGTPLFYGLKAPLGFRQATATTYDNGVIYSELM